MFSISSPENLKSLSYQEQYRYTRIERRRCSCWCRFTLLAGVRSCICTGLLVRSRALVGALPHKPLSSPLSI